MRKAIQISTVPFSDSILTTVLFDDGTVWSKIRNSLKWHQVGLPPETETKEPPLPDSEGWVKHDGDHIPAIDHFQSLQVKFRGSALTYNLPKEYTPSSWPEGAEWWAVDQNQGAYFFWSRPEILKRGFCIRPLVLSDDDYLENTIKDWTTSLRKRPEGK